MTVELDDGHRNRSNGITIVDSRGVVMANEEFWDEMRSQCPRQCKWAKYFIIADLTIKEIMAIEGVSVDTVKSWGREVRKKLRDERVRRRLEELL